MAGFWIVTLSFGVVILLIALVALLIFSITGNVLTCVFDRLYRKKDKKYKIPRNIFFALTIITEIPCDIVSVIIFVLLIIANTPPSGYESVEKIAYTDYGFISESGEKYLKMHDLSDSWDGNFDDLEATRKYSYEDTSRRRDYYNIYSIYGSLGYDICYKVYEHGALKLLYINNEDYDNFFENYFVNFSWEAGYNEELSENCLEIVNKYMKTSDYTLLSSDITCIGDLTGTDSNNYLEYNGACIAYDKTSFAFSIVVRERYDIETNNSYLEGFALSDEESKIFIDFYNESGKLITSESK